MAAVVLFSFIIGVYGRSTATFFFSSFFSLVFFCWGNCIVLVLVCMCEILTSEGRHRNLRLQYGDVFPHSAVTAMSAGVRVQNAPGSPIPFTRPKPTIIKPKPKPNDVLSLQNQNRNQIQMTLLSKSQ